MPVVHPFHSKKEICVSCGKCSNVCPMGVDVMSEIKHE
ncbi:MAG: 4Fe-4S binding protein [Lachnospiraceae bacterium]